METLVVQIHHALNSPNVIVCQGKGHTDTQRPWNSVDESRTNISGKIVCPKFQPGVNKYMCT